MRRGIPHRRLDLSAYAHGKAGSYDFRERRYRRGLTASDACGPGGGNEQKKRDAVYISIVEHAVAISKLRSDPTAHGSSQSMHIYVRITQSLAILPAKK
jgi:hypothetical protein